MPTAWLKQKSNQTCTNMVKWSPFYQAGIIQKYRIPMLFKEVAGSKCLQMHIEMRTVSCGLKMISSPVEEAGPTKEQGSSFIVQG